MELAEKEIKAKQAVERFINSKAADSGLKNIVQECKKQFTYLQICQQLHIDLDEPNHDSTVEKAILKKPSYIRPYASPRFVAISPAFAEPPSPIVELNDKDLSTSQEKSDDKEIEISQQEVDKAEIDSSEQEMDISSESEEFTEPPKNIILSDSSQSIRTPIPIQAPSYNNTNESQVISTSQKEVSPSSSPKKVVDQISSTITPNIEIQSITDSNQAISSSEQNLNDCDSTMHVEDSPSISQECTIALPISDNDLNTSQGETSLTHKPESAPTSPRQFAENPKKAAAVDLELSIKQYLSSINNYDNEMKGLLKRGLSIWKSDFVLQVLMKLDSVIEKFPTYHKFCLDVLLRTAILADPTTSFQKIPNLILMYPKDVNQLTNFKIRKLCEEVVLLVKTNYLNGYKPGYSKVSVSLPKSLTVSSPSKSNESGNKRTKEISSEDLTKEKESKPKNHLKGAPNLRIDTTEVPESEFSNLSPLELPIISRPGPQSSNTPDEVIAVIEKTAPQEENGNSPLEILSINSPEEACNIQIGMKELKNFQDSWISSVKKSGSIPSNFVDEISKTSLSQKNVSNNNLSQNTEKINKAQFEYLAKLRTEVSNALQTKKIPPTSSLNILETSKSPVINQKRSLEEPQKLVEDLENNKAKRLKANEQNPSSLPSSRSSSPPPKPILNSEVLAKARSLAALANKAMRFSRV